MQLKTVVMVFGLQSITGYSKNKAVAVPKTNY